MRGLMCFLPYFSLYGVVVDQPRYRVQSSTRYPSIHLFIFSLTHSPGVFIHASINPTHASIHPCIHPSTPTQPNPTQQIQPNSAQPDRTERNKKTPQNNRAALSVGEYSLTQTSLEQIFNAFAAQQEEELGHAAGTAQFI